MYYSDELIEEVRSRNSIEDVIGSYVHLTKKGANYWGLCPFHSEKTGSFSVNAPKQMYHCFGCNESGNVFTFLMKYENMSFQEAVQSLAERAGITLPKAEMNPESKKKADRREKIMDCNKEAAIYFYKMLKTPHGEAGLKYLSEKRRLSDETIHKFGLGYAPKDSTQVVEYLRSKGFDDDIILATGLANYNEKYGLRSLFWNRVMFPIFNANGKVIGFGGRVMGDGEPKYLNSPETEVFNKRRNLFGLSLARKSRADNIIICEGYMDVIAMHQAGFDQAVASLGTAFTSEQANILRRFSKSILLAYDSDGAGTKAALRNIGILREVGLSGKIINMKPYKDPDEFIKNLGAEAFKERIANAENSFYFEIRQLEGDFNLSDPEEKTAFHREIAKKLCRFEEEVERDNYTQAICAKYNISLESMRKLILSEAGKGVDAKPVERPKSGINKKTDKEDNLKKAQRVLLTWITDDVTLYSKVKSYISAEDFTEGIYQKVAARLFADIEEGKYNPAGIINMFQDEEEQREAAGLFNTNLPKLDTPTERAKAFHDVVLAVKKTAYEYYTSKLGSDVTALSKVVEGKRALEALEKTSFNLD